MILHFAKRLPANASGRYAHYRHRRTGGNGWEFCDIRGIIARNQETWRTELTSWHDELSRRASALTPLWWLTAGSRMTAWYPVDLKPLLFSLGIAEAAKERPDSPITVLDCPDDVKEYLSEWMTGLSPRQLVQTLQPMRRPHPLRLTASLALRILSRYFRPEPDVSRAQLLAFSYTLRGDIFTQQDDHYFGGSLDGLGKNEVLWIYYLDHLKDSAKISAHLRGKGRRHAFYFDFLSLTDLAGIRAGAFEALEKLRPLERFLPALRIGAFVSQAFPRRFYRDLISRNPPIIEMSVYTAIKRLLQTAPVRTLVYPYEEKGIERALLRACAEAGPDIRTVGFAHAVYNDGHFYLHRTAPPLVPSPTMTGTTGLAASHRLGYFSGRHIPDIPALGSPRFPLGASPLPPSEDFQENLRILFLAGYEYEIGMLADMLEHGEGLLDHCQLMIRRYPYGWSEAQEIDAARILKVLPGTRVEMGSLDDQIKWCDIVLFASTSAGIHCMLRGRPAIHVDLHDFFAVAPLHKQGGGSAVDRCPDGPSLKAALRRFRDMTRQEYLSEAAAHREEGARIYSPLDKDLLADTLRMGGRGGL